jgi:hypothetical protein
MDVKRYMNVIWLYAIGLVFIFSGLYMIASMGAGPSGFGFMVVGLMFSTIGGFYGKKKLMEGVAPAAMEDRQMDMLKQNVVSQVRVRAPSSRDVQANAPKDWDDGGDVPDMQAQEMSRSAPSTPVIKARPLQARPQPQIQPASAAPAVAPTIEVPGIAADEKGFVKIMVCPDCNTENPPGNIYCSSCGKRLRKAVSLLAPETVLAAEKPVRVVTRKKAVKKARKRKAVAPMQTQ